MIDRTELLESAFDSLPEGMGIWDGEGEVLFWNQAAEEITGYASIFVLGRPIPEALAALLADGSGMEPMPPQQAPAESHRSVAQLMHKLGHFVPVIAHRRTLNNRLGDRIGNAMLFHPVESLDALPQDIRKDDSWAEGARRDLVEHLQIEFDDFRRGGSPMGVLRISVDQAADLRKTHGAAASHAMLEKVYYALAHGLRPGEEIGYWANDGFLVIAHERNEEMLAAHAQTLARLARTADFRWWGDRVSLTVSIGAAQVSSEAGEGITRILRRAREALEASFREGGNRATIAAHQSIAPDTGEKLPCLPS